MRMEELANGEYYHICNHAVDQSDLVRNAKDADRFIESLVIFNTVDPVGSVFEFYRQDSSLKDSVGHLVSNFKKEEALVDIVAYCLNPNHFHLLLSQRRDDGISKFMKSVSGGFSKYINNKYQRKGSLFRGPFRAKRITNNEYLTYVSAYVNLNNEVHGLPKNLKHLIRSSLSEYDNKSFEICQKGIILDQFKDSKDYRKFAFELLPQMKEQKKLTKDLLVSMNEWEELAIE
ncbi:MAG TPA: transposase [Candidatus Paceibacterota bacterium]